MDESSSDPQRIMSSSAFVGRKRELNQLRAGLLGLAAGRGALFLLVGEPGIGKTRLVEEFATEARGAGARVVWGRGWESGGAPAFWPFIQVIRACAAQCDPAVLDEVLPDTIRQFLGDQTRRDANPTPPVASSTRAALAVLPARNGEVSDAARFALFDSIANFLDKISAIAPLVMILDDMHEADTDSLLLLQFLARGSARRAVIIIAIYREAEAKAPSEQMKLLASFGRDGRVVEVKGLTEQEVAEFVETRGVALSRTRLVGELAALTEGNPFFLEETLRLVSAGGGTLEDHTDISLVVPDNVRETIRRRIAPLSADARALLEIAAIAGKEFEALLVAAASDRDIRACLELLDEAAEHRIINPIKDSVGRYQFSHAMIRETITSDLSDGRRMLLHLQLGRVLEEMHQSDSGANLARIAEHYARSVPIGPWEKAVDFAGRGAARALGQLAYEEAARLYKIALDALAAAPQSQPEASCEMFVALADALANVGRFERQQEAYGRAVELARRTGRKDLLARAALGMGIRYGTVGSSVPALAGVIEEALAGLGNEDLRLRAMLTAKLAATLYWSHAHDRSIELSGKAVAMARQADDPAAVIYALWRRHYALWGPDYLDERLGIAEELTGLASRHGLQAWVLRAQEMLLSDHLEAADFRQVERVRGAYEEQLHQLSFADSLLELYRAMEAIAQGDFIEAEHGAERALETGQRCEQPGALLSYAGQIAMIRFEQGRLGELEPMLQAYSEQFPLLDVLRCGIALAYLQSGREAQARDQFDYLAREDFTAIRRDWNWLATMAAATETCVFLRDTRRAAKIYELLSPYADRCIMLGWCEVCYGAVARYLGMLSGLMKQYDQAEVHFESAIAMHLRMRARPLLAHSRYEYALTLAERNGSGDKEKATELVRSTLSVVDLLGMTALATNLRTLQCRLESSEWPLSPAAPSDTRPQQDRTTLVTVMFVDIVASTEIAARYGDARWRDLLSRFYALVRRELTARSGREIQNPGDGFLAVFERPALAIGAASEIRDLVRGLGLEVRAGIHVGECAWIGQQAVGLAVHVGARVAAQAAPSEILVTTVVRDLEIGSGLIFADAGSRDLKGVPGTWQLFRVEQTPTPTPVLDTRKA